jgi:hypothetical protein
MRKCFSGAAVVLLALLSGALIASHSAEMIWDIGVGNVASFGMFGTGLAPVNKHGFNSDLDTTEESIWDGNDIGGPVRCFTVMGDSPGNMFVSSDDAADAGLEIVMEVIRNDWSASTITMNLGGAGGGTGTVFTVIAGGTLLRINRAYATDDAFTGNVYMHIDTVDGDDNGIPDSLSTHLIAVITAGENKTQQACYTVPLNFSLGLNQFCTSNVSTAGNRKVTYRVRSSTNVGAPLNQESHQIADGIYYCTPHDPPLVFPEKTDIEITGVASGVDAIAGATFDGILFPSSFF